MQDLKVTLIQSELHWEDADANLRHFETIIQPFKNSTDLILLPEMFSTGFSMNPEQFAETMDGKAVEWMQRMAREANAVITGSLMMRDEGKFYNRLIWMRPDGTFEHYDKRHLFGLGDENKHYSGGNRKIQVSINGWNILPLICYDLRFPVWCRNRRQTTDIGQQTIDSRQQQADVRSLSSDVFTYDLLLFVANWPQRRNFAWKHLLQARAIENQSYVAAVNRIGNDGTGIYHSGDSALIDPMGEVVFTQADTAFAQTFVLSKERLSSVRKKMPFLNDADEFSLNRDSWD